MSNDNKQAQVEGFRLSPQQARLWSVQGDSACGSFRVGGVVSLRGVCDQERLNQVFASLVQQNEILRTRFECLPGMRVPVQVIDEQAVPTIEYHDASGRAEDEKEKFIDDLLAGAMNAPMDCRDAGLVRLTAVRLADAHHALIVSAPSLVLDASGLLNLVKEFVACGAKVACDDEAMQFADFSEWQNSLLEEDADEGLRFWREIMHSMPAPIAPPFGNPGAEGTNPAPHSVRFDVDADVASGLETLAGKSEMDVSSLMLACWQSLLFRLTGQDHFSIGLSCHGRTYEELEGALGAFVRELPYTCTVKGDSSFRDVAASVAERVGALFGQQEYFPAEEYAESSGVAGAPVSFEYVDHGESVSAGEWTAQVERIERRSTPFLLNLSCTRSPRGHSTLFQFDPNSLSTEDVARIATLYHTMLRAAVDAPDTPIDRLRLLDDTQRVQLLETFNAVQREYPRDRCIHELIREQAARTPGHTAVSFGSDSLTYAELESRSNQLARHLQGLGIGPETLVALCVERSIEMVVGILGILKAGGAYVPIDPAYPMERIEFMIEDARASVVLTQHRLREAFESGRIEAVSLDADWDTIATRPDTPTECAVGPENLAYVIYTSGSTGLPKGVEISHRNLVHSTTARADYYDPPTAFLLLSSFAFDSSVAGIFWTLCEGGTLVLPEEGQERDVREIATLLKRHDVSTMLGLPSVYRLVLDEVGPDQLSSLKAVVVAGEACPASLLDAHRSMLPGVSLFNEYGPTEGTVWSTVFDCTHFDAAGPVPIGRPIPNVQCYILDVHGEPVPVGVPGELYLGGEGLARGYLNRPELTAERFVPKPFESDDDSLLYKTGDRAQYRADGTIEFMGRVDHQVKIRGYRIELEEIEHVLRESGLASDATVAAREDGSGGLRLVGYIVAPEGHRVSTTELQSYLRDKLPPYMVPTAFVAMQVLPLTPNGKVDRAALPAPDQGRPDLDQEYVEPRTPVEEVFSMLWGEVLDLDRVGVLDNFFELGGHSLLVTQFVSRLHESLHVELPLRAIFETPTIAGLVESILSKESEGDRIEQASEIFLEVSNLSEEETEALLASSEESN